MHALEHFLRDLAVVLVTAGATTVLFQRLHWPVVAGYLVAGVLVGPGLTPSWVSDETAIRLLSELGVILLMFSIGLDFRLGRLARAAPTTGVAAGVEIGLMLMLGYLTGQAFGWSPLASLFVGGSAAACSTMVAAKVFEEQRAEAGLRETVVGLSLFEDLAAMIIIALLTAAASGGGLTGTALAGLVGRLIGALVLVLVVGLLAVPRAIRAIARLRHGETLLVSAVGLSFGLSYLAAAAGFSVALGAFLAGLLVAESGTGRLIAPDIRPLRDVFAAIFFVSTGMQLDLHALAAGWGFAAAFLGVVLIGRPLVVTVGVFLSGRGLQTAIRSGLSIAQIGEFSFILAGVGVALGAVPQVLVPAAVLVSVVTAFLSPWLVRSSDRAAAAIDRSLPHRVQMVASLYGSWVEALRSAPRNRTPWSRARAAARWLLVDAILTAGLVIASAAVRPQLVALAARAGVPAALTTWVVGLLTLVVASPFLLGIVRLTRSIATELAGAAIPRPPPGKVDNGLAPRRVLAVAIQIGCILLVGGPLVIVTQPFLPRLSGLAVLATILALLAVAFWRTAADLFGHFRAGAELVVAALAKQARAQPVPFEMIRQILPGLGDFTPVKIPEGSAAAGRTLGELNLRGRTGATVVALLRGQERVAFPEADAQLSAGDFIALTGSHEAISAARDLLIRKQERKGGAGSGQTAETARRTSQAEP